MKTNWKISDTELRAPDYASRTVRPPNRPAEVPDAWVLVAQRYAIIRAGNSIC